MACQSSCEPSNPCNGNGCPNGAAGAQPPPEAPAGSNVQGSSPPEPTDPPTPNPSPDHEPTPPASGTVRIGVGNTSSTDINIEVTDNLIRGGRHRVHLGSGNHAAGANTGFISGNRADGDDLLIGVDNYSAGGNNDIQVYNNDFTGFKSVRIGVGNYARGSNTIVVGGPRPPSGPNSGGGPSRPQPPSAPQLTGGAPPPQPLSGFGPSGPLMPYNPGGMGPVGPYYYGGSIPDPRMWGGYAGPGTNPGDRGYNMPPYSSRQ